MHINVLLLLPYFLQLANLGILQDAPLLIEVQLSSKKILLPRLWRIFRGLLLAKGEVSLVLRVSLILSKYVANCYVDSLVHHPWNIPTSSSHIHSLIQLVEVL